MKIEQAFMYADSRSVPSSHVLGGLHSSTVAKGPTLSSDPSWRQHAHGTYTYMQASKTVIHTKGK